MTRLYPSHAFAVRVLIGAVMYTQFEFMGGDYATVAKSLPPASGEDSKETVGTAKTETFPDAVINQNTEDK